MTKELPNYSEIMATLVPIAEFTRHKAFDYFKSTDPVTSGSPLARRQITAGDLLRVRRLVDDMLKAGGGEMCGGVELARLDSDSLDAIVEVVGDGPDFRQYNAGKSQMRRWFLGRLARMWGKNDPTEGEAGQGVLQVDAETVNRLHEQFAEAAQQKHPAPLVIHKQAEVQTILTLLRMVRP